MRRDKFAICLLFLMALSSCGNTIEIPEYDVNGVEYVAPDSGIAVSEVSTAADIAAYSSVIVKAVYIGLEDPPSSNHNNVYKFKVEKDFTGIVDEEIIHVHENPLTSFIEGKTYYLFLSGFRSQIYPHVVYTRIHSDFLMGELPGTENTDTEYTFYGDYSLDIKDVKDMDNYISSEIINAGRYDSTPENLIHEDLESAYRNADVVAIGKVMNAAAEGQLITFCDYYVDEVLKGEYHTSTISTSGLPYEIAEAAGVEEGVDSRRINIPAPAYMEIQPGDRIIVLMDWKNNDHYGMYSTEHYVYTMDSDEGKYILELAGYED